MTATKDLHAHSTYCDGKCSPEEMVKAAIEKGLTVFGISGHSYTAFDKSYCMQLADIPRFIAEMRYLRAKYFDRIHVLCGTEQDYYSDYPTDAFDYVIGSVHYLHFSDAYIPVDWYADTLRKAAEQYCGGDIYALCEEYYRTVGDVVNKTGCDLIGHFDLISKFNGAPAPLFDERHPRYVAAWQRAVDQLLPTGVPFELNTGGVYRGYKDTPYPSPEIQTYILRHGGRLVPSSDAHTTDAIAFGFDSLPLEGKAC